MELVKHARWPASAVLAASAAASLACATGGLQQGGPDVPASPTRGRAPQAVSAPADAARAAAAASAFAQAEELRGKREFAAAAEGYRRVLALDPYQPESRFRLALCLAQAGDDQGLLSFMRDLVISDAGLAVDIFERAELAPALQTAAMRTLLAEARSQAAD